MKEQEILYVYDRVCTKEWKQAEILREYGDIQIRAESPSRERRYYSEFAEAQRQRAAEARKNAPSRPSDPEKRDGASRASSGEGASRPRASEFSSEGTKTYSYRPGTPEGGEAVKTRRRLNLDWLLSLFESQEARGEADLMIAKRRAVALKKLKEYRHIIVTSMLLTLVMLLAVFGIYKLVFVIDDVSADGSEVYSAEEIAAASGIELGENLYSFRASDAENEITFLCPYIKSAAVDRSVPTSVSIAVEDDRAYWWANIWGDTVLLSQGLRVLEVHENDEPDVDGLIELILPPVDKSVAGRPLIFTSARSERYIRSVLSTAAASSLAADGMIDRIDLTNEYDITMKACGKYNLKCDGESDMDIKLKMAYATITSPNFESANRASIDLTIIGEASVMYDFSDYSSDD